MPEQKCPILASLLHEAGISWSGADEICKALDGLNIEGLDADNVCSVLYKWRTKGIRAAMGQARVRASKLMVGNGTDVHVDGGALIPPTDDDAEEQMRLFDTSDERRRFAQALLKGQ